MQAGQLDRLITIQRNTTTPGDDGFPIEAWTTVGPLRRPASVRTLSGDERFAIPAYVAREQVEFRIRYAAAVADITPLDRIIYPALSEGDSPATPIATRHIYDIIATGEIGRREGVVIKAARRSDVPE